MDKQQLYTKTFDIALKNDELKLYHGSNQQNMECKTAITEIISNNYDGARLGKDLAKQIVEEYGLDRTTLVVANSIQQKDHDGRIDNVNKDWAKGVENPIEKSSRGYYVVDNNAGLLNIFANQLCRLSKELEKPSVTKQLEQAKTTPKPKDKAIKADKEVR